MNTTLKIFAKKAIALSVITSMTFLQVGCGGNESSSQLGSQPEFVSFAQRINTTSQQLIISNDGTSERYVNLNELVMKNRDLLSKYSEITGFELSLKGSICENVKLSPPGVQNRSLREKLIPHSLYTCDGYLIYNTTPGLAGVVKLNFNSKGVNDLKFNLNGELEIKILSANPNLHEMLLLSIPINLIPSKKNNVLEHIIPKQAFSTPTINNSNKLINELKITNTTNETLGLYVTGATNDLELPKDKINNAFFIKAGETYNLPYIQLPFKLFNNDEIDKIVERDTKNHIIYMQPGKIIFNIDGKEYTTKIYSDQGYNYDISYINPKYINNKSLEQPFIFKGKDNTKGKQCVSLSDTLTYHYATNKPSEDFIFWKLATMKPSELSGVDTLGALQIVNLINEKLSSSHPFFMFNKDNLPGCRYYITSSTSDPRNPAERSYSIGFDSYADIIIVGKLTSIKNPAITHQVEIPKAPQQQPARLYLAIAPIVPVISVATIVGIAALLSMGIKELFGDNTKNTPPLAPDEPKVEVLGSPSMLALDQFTKDLNPEQPFIEEIANGDTSIEQLTNNGHSSNDPSRPQFNPNAWIPIKTTDEKMPLKMQIKVISPTNEPNEDKPSNKDNCPTLKYEDKYIQDSAGKWLSSPSRVAYKFKIEGNQPNGNQLQIDFNAVDVNTDNPSKYFHIVDYKALTNSDDILPAISGSKYKQGEEIVLGIQLDTPTPDYESAEIKINYKVLNSKPTEIKCNDGTTTTPLVGGMLEDQQHIKK